MKHTRVVAAVAAAVSLVVLAACGGDDGGSSSSEPPTELGKAEGALNLVAWPGYVEDGTNDPSADWVTSFEEETGCQVNVKIGNTSDEMVQLIKTGEYDGLSASGDATLRLIAAGDVAPVNTDLVPNYADIFEGLKLKPWNSVDGQAYGVPLGRGANVLMYNTEAVDPAPDSWNVVWESDSPVAGSVTAYDAPIYIADAAVYLMATQPDLGITNPYALDETQFNAAVDLLKQQKAIVGEYWSDYAKALEAFKTGSTKAGTTWQFIANLAQSEGAPVDVVKPKEGATGWSDTWMVASKAKHPNCMYLWMNHAASPEVNAQIAEWFGEAPANAKACALTANPDHCATFHADTEDYWSDVWYWTTPTRKCLDGREVECKDYAEWTQAWTEVKG